MFSKSSLGASQSLKFDFVVLFFQGGMGDAEYLAAFQQVVMPIAYEVRIVFIRMHPKVFSAK